MSTRRLPTLMDPYRAEHAHVALIRLAAPSVIWADVGTTAMNNGNQQTTPGGEAINAVDFSHALFVTPCRRGRLTPRGRDK